MAVHDIYDPWRDLKSDIKSELMKSAAVLLGLIFFTSSAICSSEQHPLAPAYNERDAYEIYSLLLPDEEAYQAAKGTVVIQQETLAGTSVELPPMDAHCIDVQTADKFREANIDLC
jgi:hypothetical protein